MDEYDLFIAKVRYLLFFWFGLLYFLTFCFSDNISIDKTKMDYKIIVSILFLVGTITYMIQKLEST
jgi:hypothetical protein